MKSDKKNKNIVVKKVNQPKVTNKNSNKLIWIVGGIVFVVLAAGAIYFGTKNTENKFGDILSDKPIKPTPTIHIVPKKPDTEAHPPEPMETIPPQPEPTGEIKPTIVPNEDTDYTDKFLILFSGYQKLVNEDLKDFSNLDLKKARNEIYARHGRSFVSQDMACYFAKQSWYQVNPDYSEKLLSSLEVSNAVFILNYEKEKQSSLVNKDSGCVQ